METICRDSSDDAMTTIIWNNNLDNNSKLKLFLIMNKPAVNL